MPPTRPYANDIEHQGLADLQRREIMVGASDPLPQAGHRHQPVKRFIGLDVSTRATLPEAFETGLRFFVDNIWFITAPASNRGIVAI